METDCFSEAFQGGQGLWCSPLRFPQALLTAALGGGSWAGLLTCRGPETATQLL